MTDNQENNKGPFYYISKIVHHLFALVGFCLLSLVVVNLVLSKYKTFHLLTKNWYVLSDYVSLTVNNTNVV